MNLKMSDIDEFKTNRQCADLYMNKRKRHLAPDDEEKYIILKRVKCIHFIMNAF